MPRAILPPVEKAQAANWLSAPACAGTFCRERRDLHQDDLLGIFDYRQNKDFLVPMYHQESYLYDTPCRNSIELKRTISPGREYFCGPCKNRLALTTGGRNQLQKDKSIYHDVRDRYQCHYNVRHPGEGMDSQAME